MSIPSAKKVRITHILEASIGGTRRHIFQIAEHIDTTLFELSFILSPTRSPESVSEDIQYLTGKGFSVFAVDMQREISPLRDISAWLSLYRLLRAIRPHIVHTHASKAGVLGRTAARAAGVRFCFHTPHLWAFDWEENPVLREFYTAVERFAASMTDEILTVSNNQAKEANALSVAPVHKTVPIRNTVELMDFANRKPNNRPFTVGTTGRLAKQKGHSFLLNAFSALLIHAPEARLLICGEGPLEADLRQLAASLNIHDSVSFVGHVPDIFSFLEEIDLFVLPSLWEGLPYALLEAMSASLPVIATDVNGIREVIFDGWNGWLVPPENPDSLAAAMQSAYDNPAERVARGRNARATLNNYDVADFVRALEWRYISAMRKKPIFHG